MERGASIIFFFLCEVNPNQFSQIGPNLWYQSVEVTIEVLHKNKTLQSTPYILN